MDPRPHVLRLSWLVAVLGAFAAACGLFWPGDAGPAAATTARGERVELYGEGLYRYDSLFKGAANVATDLVSLAVAVPLLIVAVVLYGRGSLRGAFLLLGALAWFLYLYATLAVGTAHNELFLVYVALFSASLFALVLLFSSLDARGAHEQAGFPRRGIAVLMLAGGALTLVVWAGPQVDALVTGDAPKWLDTNTTMVTDALDLAVLTPSALLAGVLLHRGHPLGYRIAFPLLVLLVMLAPAIVAQSIKQESAGIDFTTGEIVGPTAGFIVLGAIALWFAVRFLRALSDDRGASA